MTEAETSRAMKTCTLCGQDFESSTGLGQCKKCLSLKARLYRQFKRNTDSQREDAENERNQWNSLSRIERQSFFTKWHGEVHVDLSRAISETLLESVSKHESSPISPKWLDEFQLNERYKGREEQVENIKKNAESKECKVRGVMLWADPEYTVNEMARQESNRQLKRELSMCTVSNPEKVQKVDPAPNEEPKFTEKQEKMLETEQTKTRELLKKVKLTNHKANLPELVKGIKKEDRDPLKKREITLASMMATLDKSIGSGSGHFKELRKKIRALRSEVKTDNTKLKKCIADAEELVDQGVTEIIQKKMEEAEELYSTVRL